MLDHSQIDDLTIPDFKQGMKEFMLRQESKIHQAIDALEARRVLENTHHVAINMKYLQRNWEERHGYFCSKCGAPETAHYSNEARLRDRQLCFSCNFWEEKAEQLPGEYIIINHVLYLDGGHQPNTNPSFLGFAGRLWHIQMNDGRTIVTNNLWTGGRMPHEYWERFPDNAKFVQEEK